jgi:hypothetical protein
VKSIGRHIRTFSRIGICALTVSFLVGCHLPKDAPKVITVDGVAFFACHGWVWISDEGEWGDSVFSISFQDKYRLNHELHGLKKFTIADIPKVVEAKMPYNPSLTDNEGNAYKVGSIYTWGDDSKARWTKDGWKSVMVHNSICNSSDLEEDVDWNNPLLTSPPAQ